MQNCQFRSLIVLLLLTFSFQSFGQGDGPRAYLLAPKGVTGINVKWLSMGGNLIPSGSVLIPGADITATIFPTTIFHTFSIGGRFAQVFGMIPPGSSTAKARIGPPIGPIPVNEISASGNSDGFLAFKLGLVGAPALDVIAFSKSEMQFSLFGEFRYWYSGTYSSDDLFNLGTNRSILHFGLPMAIPLNRIRAKATWLEIAPAIQFFTDNKDPARSSTAQLVEQAPMFILESHLSHNFTPKFWAVANLRFQTGGQTSADGENDNNSMTALGGGLGIGYQLLAPLGLEMDYGGVLSSTEALKGNMLRVSVVFTYADLKKLQPAN